MKSVHFILILFFASVASFAQEKKWTLKECIYHAIKNNITIKLIILLDSFVIKSLMQYLL